MHSSRPCLVCGAVAAGHCVRALIVAKVVEFGWFEYVRHFTNWSWTMQTLFYAITLLFIIVPDGTAIFVGLTFLPLVTIVFSVWVGSSVLLIRDPAFITPFLAQWPAGVVMLGNDAVHVLPVIIIIFYAWLQGPLVGYGLRRTAHAALYGWGPVYFLVFCVWQTWGGALLAIGLYRMFFDPNEVYRTTLPEAEALGLPLVVGLIVAGVPLIMLTLFHGLTAPVTADGDTWMSWRMRVLLTDYEMLPARTRQWQQKAQ